MIGRVSSFHSFSTHDGPGIRAVVFLQGCPLRCQCCHNPETWAVLGGKETSVEEVMEKIKKGKSYYRKGGVTCSGGEPLLQPEFVKEIFKESKKLGLHTTVDTSGQLFNDAIKEVLEETDLVLLDIKKTTEEKYDIFAKGSLKKTMDFLDYLEQIKKPVWIRHVAIPGQTTKETVEQLKKLIAPYTVIEKVEFLPFKKLCITKYDDLGMEFPLKDTEELSPQELKQIQKWFDEK